MENLTKTLLLVNAHRLVVAIALGIVWFFQFTISGYLHGWGESLFYQYEQYKGINHESER
jgi:hypothetical protein